MMHSLFVEVATILRLALHFWKYFPGGSRTSFHFLDTDSAAVSNREKD
jgi:hypothetical protein